MVASRFIVFLKLSFLVYSDHFLNLPHFGLYYKLYPLSQKKEKKKKRKDSNFLHVICFSLFLCSFYSL